MNFLARLTSAYLPRYSPSPIPSGRRAKRREIQHAELEAQLVTWQTRIVESMIMREHMIARLQNVGREIDLEQQRMTLAEREMEDKITTQFEEAALRQKQRELALDTLRRQEELAKIEFDNNKRRLAESSVTHSIEQSQYRKGLVTEGMQSMERAEQLAEIRREKVREQDAMRAAGFNEGDREWEVMESSYENKMKMLFL